MGSPVTNVVFERRAKLLYESQHWTCCTITERANGVTGNVRGHLGYEVEFIEGCLACNHFLENSIEPPATFATGGALAARLMLVELHEVAASNDRVRCVAQHDGTAGA